MFLVNSLGYSFTFYLNYILCLNYWESNFALLLGFIVALISLNKLPCVAATLLIIFLRLATNLKMYGVLIIKKKLIHSLWAGTVVIHPLIFYMFLLISCVTFYLLKSNNIRNLCLRMSDITVALLFTLCLGGLWGLQSLTWGYVWVSDGIEWLLLTLCVYTAVFYHRTFTKHSSIFICMTLVYIVNLLIFIRLNVVTTRHSFLTNYSTTYIILGFLLTIFILVITNISLTTNSVSFCSTDVTIVCILTGVLLYASTVGVIKYLFCLNLVFYLIRLQTYIYSQKLLLHFGLFLTGAAWSTYYAFFFLNFISMNHYNLNPAVIYNKVFLWTHLIQNSIHNNYFLENITFAVGECLKSINFFKFNMTFSIIFNNYTVVIIIILLLFKTVWI